MNFSLPRVRFFGVLSLGLFVAGGILTTNGKDATLVLVLQVAGALLMFLFAALIKRMS